jgi:hypothetical protein
MKKIALIAIAAAVVLPFPLNAQMTGPSDLNDRVVTISAMEFLPVESDITHSLDPNTAYRTFSHPVPTTTPHRILAPVHLPDGARVTGMSLDFCRMEGGMYVFLEEACLQSGRPDCGGVSIQEDVSTEFADPNTCGQNYVPINSRQVIDNQFKQYFLVGQFSCGAGPCVSFRAVRLFYVMEPLQAPPVPTFSDVPTTSPYFRSIEALYAAGATGGCGSGKFCPQTPVTREQLAAILAYLTGAGW